MLNRFARKIAGIASSPVRKLATTTTTSEPVLPHVDFSLPAPDFNRHAFAGLAKAGGLIINNLEKSFSSSTGYLFEAYASFLRQSKGKKKPFFGTNDPTAYHGYYPAETFLLGTKGVDRFVIPRNSLGYTIHPLPDPVYAKFGMQEKSDELHETTAVIFQKMLGAMESGLDLPDNALRTLFRFPSAMSLIDRHLPVTQEKLQSWIPLKKLTKTDDGRIESFLAHQDLSAFTVLVYQNNRCQGFELNTSPKGTAPTFKPLGLKENNPYNLQLVVLAGTMVETLTNGKVKAPEHRVVIEPMKKDVPFYRTLYSTFFSPNPDVKELKPLLTSTERPNYPPISLKHYFDDHAKKYTADGEANAVNKLSQEELDRYPKECDIVREETLSGTVFRRR
ncbi:MAG TPA: 2OG-Fe(II) oxygenase family protein [Gammaproteobacteria bacterium]|nr:2OG-Fe(II) oxygenase family protein [Gammaproteobacteria bacterium]